MSISLGASKTADSIPVEVIIDCLFFTSHSLIPVLSDPKLDGIRSEYLCQKAQKLSIRFYDVLDIFLGFTLSTTRVIGQNL